MRVKREAPCDEISPSNDVGQQLETVAHDCCKEERGCKWFALDRRQQGARGEANTASSQLVTFELNTKILLPPPPDADMSSQPAQNQGAFAAGFNRPPADMEYLCAGRSLSS